MVEAGRRFDFKRCLGAGGFGEVYLASMTSASGVETEVAVKMLHEGLDPRSQAVQRLRDEGRLLGTLNHPSVLKVHDLVLLDGRVALVMEYVPGLDLEQCVELAQPIGLRAGLEVIGRVADALHIAYTSDGPDGQPLRLVHRDIKPPNVRIGQHGEVKVLDFGIAKAADARREAKTQTSVMIGSPWYMAPERFDGKNDGAPADVYALGCSLYEVAARAVAGCSRSSRRASTSCWRSTPPPTMPTCASTCARSTSRATCAGCSTGCWPTTRWSAPRPTRWPSRSRISRRPSEARPCAVGARPSTGRRSRSSTACWWAGWSPRRACPP
ncbi:MAG: serine/threonine protein kinase [Alphaproteobacteria bacterium]|nr:serine/threonine protein kinase [Alphaproteobacteria bacterium]